MASTKLSAISNQVIGPTATDRLYIVEDMGGTPAEGYIEFEDLQRQMLGGPLYNGVITVSVASNNLTVAIKTISGDDPSASNPVTVRIGASYYQITSALSVTLNAGTNYFNSGHGLERYYFVYVSYNSGVILGFGQLPYFMTSSDYNNTNTSQLYLARSGTLGNVENIGMFKATLGTGASYNWSIDSTPVYHGPRYITPKMEWVSTLSAVTIGTGGSYERYYYINGKYQYFRYGLTLGSSGFSVSASTIPLPIAVNGYTFGSVQTVGKATFVTSGGLIYTGGMTLSGTTLTVNSITRSSDTAFRLNDISSTVPFTWAAGDKMYLEGMSLLG